MAFIVFGRFKMYEDWPTWQKKNMPPNAALLELKMLAAKKGYGRIMFALALALSMNRGFQGAVLEGMLQSLSFVEYLPYLFAIQF
jgi:hypothetical protein